MSISVKYFSSLVEQTVFNNIYDLKKKPSFASYKFHNSLIEGLKLNNLNVEVYSIIPINKRISSNRILRKKVFENSSINYVNKINFPFIKNIVIFFKTLLIVLKSKRDTVIMFDVLLISMSLAIFVGTLFKRNYKIGIVTDLPQFMPISKYKILRRLNEIVVSNANKYIILNENMIGKIGISADNYILIDGFANNIVDNPYENKEKVVLYTGGIYKSYGIQALCDSFIKANINEYELHLYGDGDFVTELLEITKKNKKIKYFGTVHNDEIIEIQRKCSFLVNPRHSSETFSKYSFPSKILEYLSSGTPVIMYHLDGMDKIYSDLANIIPNEEYPDFSEYLKKTLNDSKSKYIEKSIKAIEYLKKHKNIKNQTEQIIACINNV